jgi:hypothetical protein
LHLRKCCDLDYIENVVDEDYQAFSDALTTGLDDHRSSGKAAAVQPGRRQPCCAQTP